MKLLDLLNDHSETHNIGSVGSPSSTTEILIDINQKSESKKILGQLVYFVQPQEQNKQVVIGQISEVETQNRWHQDLTFRGIIKRRGYLPNLSGKADVRSAMLSVQSCFNVDESGCVSEATLGISPSTGSSIYSVRDEILDSLLEQYSKQIMYLGHAYGTKVKLPLWLKHFERGEGGAGEAYHIGVFGKSGSGKSGFAAYMLMGYARHKNMGIIFIDPQSQFTSDTDLPFKLHPALRAFGRDVRRYSLTNQLKLGTQNSATKLFVTLLQKTSFFREIGVRSSENQEYAREEIERIINRVLANANANLDTAPANLLRDTLNELQQDVNALTRIYASPQPRQRLVQMLVSLLTDDNEFLRINRDVWQPVLDLFLSRDSRGNQRISLWRVIQEATTAEQRPIVFIDIRGEGTDFADSDEVKALILREISVALRVSGETAFRENRRLNCLICLDEAHRFVRANIGNDDNSEMSNLTRTFVDGVRTTRKYGLGYMFITQTIASLHKEIVGQLRMCAFGYGLTSGSEFNQIEDMVSDKQALSLYKSFVDPQSNRQFPFMLTGPISPLSFTGSPLFVQMFTQFEEYTQANKTNQ